MAETLLDIAMMHSETVIARAKQGDQDAQGKLVQLWYNGSIAENFYLDVPESGWPAGHRPIQVMAL